MTLQVYKNIFITGKIGCGKTTLIKEVTLPILNKIGGFYTEEISDSNNKRLGYKLKTFSGQEGIFASKELKSEHKLNKYGLEMNVIEGLGVKSVIDALQDKEVIVIDEVGTMGIISQLFRETLVKCLSSEKKVLATIRFGSQPYTDEISKMADTQLVLLNRENYPEIKKQIKDWLEKPWEKPLN
ncbi:MAG: hypothetical protein A3J83_05160 [Elusimicrobia bacterium RIFOXYA2_FULL_40_6]|nr:MAG: hypothetical protein A3J83_05160 [Elusimicrobia bacterium RIFOXYA2_FULL_40_6]